MYNLKLCSKTEVLFSLCGRLNNGFPRDVRVLILGSVDSLISWLKELWLKTLGWGDNLGLSRWAQANDRSPLVGRRKKLIVDVMIEVRLDLFKEGATSQGMQVASRS